MIPTQEYGSQGRRAIVIGLALGAVLGAAAGAGVGAAMGDVASWTSFGIPAGISIALAVGSFVMRPARHAHATSWMMEDDAVPVDPPARTEQAPTPGRSTTEAA